MYVIAFLFYLLSMPAMAELSEAEERQVRCLSDKGATLYAVTTCPHCEHQKEILGSEVVDKLDVFYCDNDLSYCRNQGVFVTPMWTLDSGKHLSTGSLEHLAQQAGCT